MRGNLVIHLDAVQGNSEARTVLYAKVLLGSTAVFDAVKRQEWLQAAWSNQECGSHDG